MSRRFGLDSKTDSKDAEMAQGKEKEPCSGTSRQIKDALTRKQYHSDDERLKDAQAYIWLSIGVVVISLIIFLGQIMKCL